MGFSPAQNRGDASFPLPVEAMAGGLGARSQLEQLVIRQARPQ